MPSEQVGINMANILIIDDKDANRKVLTNLLRHTGHRILEASNGADGLSKAHADLPDLIITDLLMPVMDGFEFVRNLRKDTKYKGTPVIFCTATYLEPNARTLADSCGPNHFVTKPFEPSELLDLVQTALIAENNHRQSVPEQMPDLAIREMHLKLLQDKLAEKIDELELVNASLEERVQIRTQELEAANEKLGQQMGERDRANQELQRSRKEQIELKDQFLSNVSHELRSPLTVIHEFVSILIDGLGGPINADQREYLEIALRNANQLKRMIDDLLEVSRGAEGKLSVKRSVTSPGEIVKQTICSFGASVAKMGISVRSDIQAGLPAVYADPWRVCQVLTNLLDNAVKFSQENSAITVRAHILEEDPSFVCFSVVDNGCGIKPEESERVFDRLHQSKNALQTSRRGLGLGLYICKELIDLHGGRIWHDGKRQGGCTMLFTLPIFSTARMIAPIVKKCTPTDNSFALLAVEVSPRNGWSSEQKRAKTRSIICSTIEHCILPDLDVLLPPQSRAEKSLFWIVARANQKGAEVLEKRIREQLSDVAELKQDNISCTVSAQILKTDLFESDSPMERHVESVIAVLDKLLQVGNFERTLAK
jgi:signal transduction histidine kinase